VFFGGVSLVFKCILVVLTWCLGARFLGG
jgi:hypothetical protein